MRPSDFIEVKEKFEKEQVRWEALKPGMIVYEECIRSFEPEHYEHEIISIDINNRKLVTKDYSQHGKIVDLTCFSTEAELKKRGISFKD